MDMLSVVVATVAVSSFIYIFIYQLIHRPVQFPASVPVVGIRKQLFPAVRASLRQLTDGIKTLSDGYDQYSRHGRPFLVHEPSFSQELMLPPEHIKWFSEQSDSTLSSVEIRKERHAVRYLHIGVEFDSTVFFLDRVIGDSLTRKLGMIQRPMYEEICQNIDEVFGMDETQWKTVSVYSSMQTIILPAMSRVFFGLPLGRDSSFLTSFSRYIVAMGIGTIVVGELPRVLKGLVVPIFNVPLWYYRRKTMKAIVPAVRQQLAETCDGEVKSGQDRYDFIAQSVKVSQKMSVLKDTANAETIAEWIMLMGFAALTSTVIQASNLLLDILYSDSQVQAYESLRDEAASVLKTDDDWQNGSSFRQLTLADSAIRESLRYHPILIKGLTKEVVRSEGLELPDGTHVPHGGWIGIPVLGFHMDERFYPSPHHYDPFRFARLKQEREDAAGSTEQRPSTNDLNAGQPTSTYLGFGHGRHSCPGRWFAVQMLKIIMAYLTLNYEIEPIGAKPQTKVVGDAALPPMSATVRVRRKKHSGSG